jgi:hypothetical protein
MNMKPVFGLRTRLLALISFCALACRLADGQVVPPDIQVSVERIDPLDGKMVWSFPLDRTLRPYRCEAYTNRIVAFLYRVNAGLNFENTEVVFLDAKTGKRTAPFDTRYFIWANDDPQITRSRHGSQGSVEEERCEISLPKGCRSRGVAGLSWRNAGGNDVYFFRGSRMQWSMTLPEGAYNLSHWNEILVSVDTVKKGTE